MSYPFECFKALLLSLNEILKHISSCFIESQMKYMCQNFNNPYYFVHTLDFIINMRGFFRCIESKKEP